MNDYLKALKILKDAYAQECASAGNPCDWIPNEAVANAINELEYALGFAPDMVDPCLLVHPDCLK